MIGPGSGGLEVAVVRSHRKPTQDALRNAWKSRQGGRAAPVLLVVLYSNPNSTIWFRRTPNDPNESPHTTTAKHCVRLSNCLSLETQAAVQYRDGTNIMGHRLPTSQPHPSAERATI